MYWDQLTIGYLAALIDGEGHIKHGNTGVCVVVSSTDYDIVQRAYDMSGIGTIQGPYTNKGVRVRKQHWKWNVSRQKDIARLLCAIAPLMSNRKRTTQILPVTEYLLNRSGSKTCEICQKTYIPNGVFVISKYCSRECYRSFTNSEKIRKRSELKTSI